MSLKDILQKLIENGNPTMVDSDNTPTNADTLLNSLSERMLNRKAHMQPGLYIADINDAGYLGSILYRFRGKGN